MNQWSKTKSEEKRANRAGPPINQLQSNESSLFDSFDGIGLIDGIGLLFCFLPFSLLKRASAASKEMRRKDKERAARPTASSINLFFLFSSLFCGVMGGATRQCSANKRQAREKKESIKLNFFFFHFISLNQTQPSNAARKEASVWLVCCLLFLLALSSLGWLECFGVGYKFSFQQTTQRSKGRVDE